MANTQRDVAKERRWRDLVRRQAAGGLSVRAFCRRESLSEASFYAWRRTIDERDGARRTKSPSSPSARPPAFVPIAATDEPRREAGFVVELAGGRVLRLPEGIAAARLAELVLALEAQVGAAAEAGR